MNTNRRSKIVILFVLVLGLLAFIPLNIYADDEVNLGSAEGDIIQSATTVYSYDFEAGWGDWYADNGVWQVGTPTNPAWCHGLCAGTVLDGNYPADTDSRLVSPIILLPSVTGSEEVHLRFQNWFSYASADSGQVQVSAWDPVTLTWGSWTNVGASVWATSGWSLKDLDLTAYAGKAVRIAFYHVAGAISCGYGCLDWSVSTGWYIDDIEVVVKVPTFTGDFESGWGDWGAGNGVWQVGTPKVGVGPGSCYTGTQCAGTELNGNYGADTDSSLVSSTIQLPSVSGFEEVHLRFQNWFSYASADYGQVHISAWDPVTSAWGTWVPKGASVWATSGWSLKDLDLTAYAGKAVRIAFTHYAGAISCGYGCLDWSVSTGWYIDDIEVVVKVPTFTGDFESGWGDWGAGNGVWQVGTPKVGVGPGSCYTGTQCAGTELNGNYGADTDSSLVSPTIQLPSVSGFEEVHLRFQNWFSYASADYGQVHISAWDPVTSAWGTWVPEGATVWATSGGWSLKDVNFTAYAGKSVRIAFTHYAGAISCGYGCLDWSVSTGWYIDDIQIKCVNCVPFTVTPSAGTGGTISPSTPQTVNYGLTTIFTVTANTGYSIASVTGCGGSLTGNTYTTAPITADCTVTATFNPLCAGRVATIVGTAGTDTIIGTAGADVIHGLGGNDTIYGMDGSDIICGGDGSDTIYAGNGYDRLLGGLGNDKLYGGAGKDILIGGYGNDMMNGGLNIDSCDGGPGTTDSAVNCETVIGVP